MSSSIKEYQKIICNRMSLKDIDFFIKNVQKILVSNDISLKSSKRTLKYPFLFLLSIHYSV